MTSRLIAIVLLTLALPATAVFAQAPSSVGQIVALQGSASAVGADGASRALALKSPVYMKDKIATTTGSRLQIMFIDGSVVSQGEKSSMTIDEYVFSPSKKSDNACTLNLAQGLFRVVTDRITKLNPDRFKVKTKMATIGIRGCDLGFSLQPGEERIFAFTLQGNEEVTVTRSMSDAERARLHTGLMGLLNLLGLTSADSGTITIDDSRMMVVLVDGQPAQVIEIPWDELRNVLQGVQVESGSAANPNAGSTPATGGQTAGAPPTDAGVFLAWLSSFVHDAAPPQQPDPPPPNTPSTAGAGNGGTGSGNNGSDNGNGNNGNGTANSSATPDVRSFIPRTPGGTDWSWGVWALNGLPDSVAFTGTTLAPTDFQSIANGAQLYNLSGNGNAAAVIFNGGGKSLIEGNCTLNVLVGSRVTPGWNGVFSMQSAANSDSLTFESEGAILSDGKLTGNQISYQLQSGGQTYGRDSISAENIQGHLVGPGSGTTPITGAIGTFSFSHGTGPQVNGGFGADVRVR